MGLKKQSNKKGRKKIKCWEFFNCGAIKCPAYGSQDLRCWLFTGTYCHDEIQGTFIRKIEACMKCAVFMRNFSHKNFEDTFMYVLHEINFYVDMIENARANLEGKVKQRTEELEKASKKLKQTQEQLIQSEKLAAMGQLVAAMVHEINNPVGGMLNCIHEFREGIQDEEQVEECTALMQEGLEHIGAILRRFLIFSSDHKLNQQLTDVNKIVKKAIILCSKYKSPGQKIEHELDPEIPFVRVDPEQIQQVFLNMILNAFGAMRENGKLLIKTKRHNNSLEISFKDDGHGIKAKYLKEIFAPFFTTKKARGGKGLGLSISETIIKRHNGTIAVQSKVGKGTVFTISLPVE
ncbi:MAG: hypothetical protein E3J78_05315 [Candidatus Cloacimonadota bacterium]|nr:MAG: hypothetical protein E3J78_05315 [Candidatus Cloacimonadota bacterium]